MGSAETSQQREASSKDEEKIYLNKQNLPHPPNNSCLLELSCGSITYKKSSIEWLSECGLDSVEESHGFRDAVETQNTCTVIQVHSYSGGLRARDRSTDCRYD